MKSSSVVLAVLGPRLDETLAQELSRRAQASGGCCRYLAPVPHEDCMQAIADADVLVNSSLSEGLASAVLEAMALGTVVVARRNDGNAAVIRHLHNGALFDSPQDFVGCVERLVPRLWPPQNSQRAEAARVLRRTLTEQARSDVASTYSVEREREGLRSVLRMLPSWALPVPSSAWALPVPSSED